MSRLIKSSLLTKDGVEKVSIKVAPIFTRHQSDHTVEPVTHSIDHINNMIQNAKDDAKRILEQAAVEKRNVLQDIEEQKKSWIHEKKQWMDQAYLEGHEQGFKAGKKEALTQYESNIQEAKRTIELATVEHDKKVESSIETIVHLSMKVAEKILGHTIESHPSSYTQMVQNALKEVKEKEEIKIFVSLKQYPIVVKHKQLLQNIINSHFELSIFPESELPDDGCWIDSSAGRMEVSVQTQLIEVKEKLLQLVRAGSHL